MEGEGVREQETDGRDRETYRESTRKCEVDKCVVPYFVTWFLVACSQVSGIHLGKLPPPLLSIATINKLLCTCTRRYKALYFFRPSKWVFDDL